MYLYLSSASVSSHLKALSSSSFILNQSARPIKTMDRGQTGIHRICNIYNKNSKNTVTSNVMSIETFRARLKAFLFGH